MLISLRFDVPSKSTPGQNLLCEVLKNYIKIWLLSLKKEEEERNFKGGRESDLLLTTLARLLLSTRLEQQFPS